MEFSIPSDRCEVGWGGIINSLIGSEAIQRYKYFKLLFYYACEQVSVFYFY